MNKLRGLLRNKRLLAGGAVVVGVAGAVALKRRAGSGGGSGTSGEVGSSSPAGTGSGGGGGIGGGYDSTATDLAGSLSAYGQAQQNALAAFGDQLSTSLDALANPKTPAPSGTGVGGTSPKTPTTPVTPKKPAPKPAPKPAGPKVITIKRGDTLSALARANHTTVAALAKANKIRNPNVIVAGKKLTIPAPVKKK